MAIVKPFSAIRPAASAAKQVAALPYDVYNRKEACDIVSQNPLSFLQSTVRKHSSRIPFIPMIPVFIKKQMNCFKNVSRREFLSQTPSNVIISMNKR